MIVLVVMFVFGVGDFLLKIGGFGFGGIGIVMFGVIILYVILCKEKELGLVV